jgi:hypothetical protein
MEQNRRRRPRPNPSAHSFSLLPLPCRSERATELIGRRATQREEEMSPRRRLEPLAGVRAHRWVDAPPSSGLTAASLRARAHR